MKRTWSILLVLTACSPREEAASDAAVPLADAPRASDAPRDSVSTDAPPSELCSSDGWCAANGSPNYAWALSVPPGGQAWTVAYGATSKLSIGWQFFDLGWADLVDPFVRHNELYTVHAVSPTDVWVGGQQGYVGHFNGGSWTEFRPAAPWPQGIWGAASDDVWVLYDSGLRYHWDGATLGSKPTSTVRYAGAWGRGAADVWGFGEIVISGLYKAAIDHFDGTTWTSTVVPGGGQVISLWAAGPTDIYAVVSLNTTTRVVHGDGATWTTIADPSVVQMFGVWGRAANDVWLVGAQGRIAHWNGTTWSGESSGSTKSLADISGTATTIWITGDGVALHRP